MVDVVERPGGAEVAAIYSNFFVIVASPEIVRLSFGEAFGTAESAIYRTAVALSPANARTLAETILNFVKVELAGDSPAASG